MMGLWVLMIVSSIVLGGVAQPKRARVRVAVADKGAK